MENAKITHPCLPPGTQMSFLAHECPAGWEFVREKPPAEIPNTARGARVITCVKLKDEPAWKDCELNRGV